jgi:DNA-binding NarL/FixJ family response regulator
VHSLTPREVEILGLLADGRTAVSIAHHLGIARATVCKHLEHIYRKLGQHDRLSAVVFARDTGILT